MSEACPCGFDAAKFEARPEKVIGAWRWHREVCTIWLKSENERLKDLLEDLRATQS